MLIPARYLKGGLATWANEEGEPLRWPTVGHYPPPGNFPIGLFDIGNGDEHSFYWPIGREDAEPIVCETYHDEWSYQPKSSSLEGLIRLWLADTPFEPDDWEYRYAIELAELLGVEVPNAIPESPEEWLALDPNSPKLLLEASRASSSNDDVSAARTYIEKALDILPEYTAALIQLASLQRRMQQMPVAARTMLDAIGSPSCFGGDRKKCLDWLQRLRNDGFPELASDPLWNNRHRLTFATGVKTNDDFAIYEEAIEAYLETKQGVRAVRLRVLVGELMWSETTSFRDRYGYSEDVHRTRLRDDVERAGLKSRLAAFN